MIIFFIGLWVILMGRGTASQSFVKQQEEGEIDRWRMYDAAFKASAAQYGFDWKYLKAIALNESSLGTNPRVVNKQWSYDGKSRGLMQLTIPTANDYYQGVTTEDLDDADLSIQISAQFFAHLLRKFSSLEYAVKSYNEGEGNGAKDRLAEQQGRPEAYPAAEEYWQRFQNHLKLIEENL